jgi:membrane protease subunit HflC
MRNIAIPILIAIILVVMALYLVAFQVRETESAFITRFGKPVREKTEPGLYFKWPTPVEQVHKFDSRMRVLDGPLAETTAKGAVAIIVKTYVVWRVAEPLKFLNAVQTVENAEEKLLSQISDTQNRIIGGHTFGEFVNSDPDKIQFEQIQQLMLADLQQPVRNEYGIEIKTLGIKQLKVSEDVTKNVFARMRADRERRTRTTISRGEAEAIAIRTDANRKKIALEAAAEARAEAIRGQGDAEAARHYEKLEADPDLAMFLRNLKALRKTLSERATIVIPADTEPFSLLKEMPSLNPASGKN